MLKSTRLLLALVAMLSFAPSALALTVNDYITTAPPNTTDFSRVIVIQHILDSSSVTFDEGEFEDSAFFSFCSNGECGATTLELEGGVISINRQLGNIEYTPYPDNPNPLEPVVVTYQVEVFLSDESTATGQANLIITNRTVETDNENVNTIGNAVTDICTNNPTLTNSTLTNACTEFLSLSEEDQATALSTISPEEVVAEFTSTVNMTKDQTGNLSNRLNALRGGATGVSVAGLNYIQGNDVLPGSWLHEMADQVGGNASADQSFSPFGFFINGSITSGEKDSTNLESGYDLDGDSITLGMDYRFSESLVAGIAYGISNSEIEFSSTNEITNEIDNLLVYGSWYKEEFYIDAVLGFADGEIETDRLISVGTISEVADGKTDSSQIFFSLTGNYDFNKGAWSYGPYASFDYIDGEIDGYDEIGTTGFEVAFDDQDIESQVLTFGGRVQYAWSQSWGIVVPYGRVEWKNELNDDRDAIVGRFVLDTSNDSGFSIQADDLDASWFQVGVGVSATFQRGLSAYIDYETVVSYDDTEIDTFSFGGRWETKF